MNTVSEQKLIIESQKVKLKNRDVSISNLRNQRHDYNKHLQVILSLLDSNMVDNTVEYILNISKNFNTRRSRYGNISYLDAIASLKYEECLSKNIKFNMHIQNFIDNLAISPNEMSIVIINIIDNAIDALMDFDKSNKFINVQIYEEEFQYVISIKNNGPKIKNIDNIFAEGFSTKGDSGRGYGLFSAKCTLDKFGYHIFVNSDDFITEFTILIPKYK